MDGGLYARAVHHHGVLRLLDPLDLPEGVLVKVVVHDDDRLRYPTRLVSAAWLDKITGLVAVGGDALADSEAEYA